MVNYNGIQITRAAAYKITTAAGIALHENNNDDTTTGKETSDGVKRANDKSPVKIVNPMCADCAMYGIHCTGTTAKVCTDCTCKVPLKNKPVCMPKLIYKPENATDYPYFVQLWYSYDGGETNWNYGVGRYFRDKDSAADYIKTCQS